MNKKRVKSFFIQNFSESTVERRNDNFSKHIYKTQVLALFHTKN